MSLAFCGLAPQNVAVGFPVEALQESPQGWLQGIQDPAREYERQSCTPRHFEVQTECSGKVSRLCTATLTGPVQHGSPLSTCLSHSMW